MSKTTSLPSPARCGGAGVGRAGQVQRTAALLTSTAKKQAAAADNFIIKARALHGEKYDYSQAVYTKAKMKVDIICPRHGLFQQAPDGHLRGSGCPKCGDIKIGLARRKTLAIFIAEAQAMHGMGTYDYSQVVYTNKSQLVNIICSKHGVFKQQPNNHRQGQGCPKCGIDSIRLTPANFIAKSQEVHGVGTYNYSQVVYRDTRTKVIICCPTHGVFTQTPNSHLAGHGCATCAQKKRARDVGVGWAGRARGRLATLYLLRVFDEHEEFFKIGKTLSSVPRRYHSKHSLSGYFYEIIALHKSANASGVQGWERAILETFAHLRYKPRRRFGGETECFHTVEPILQIFPL